MKKPLSIRKRREAERLQYGENVMRMFRVQGTDFSNDDGKFSDTSGNRIACRILLSCPKCNAPSILHAAGVCFQEPEDGFDETAHAHVMCENGHEGTVYFVPNKAGDPFQVEVTFDRKKNKREDQGSSHGKKIDLAELKMLYELKADDAPGKDAPEEVN